MDKSDLILEKLNSMEKALRSEIKTLSEKQDAFTVNLDMTWQAVQEVRDELANNSVKIKSLITR
jgi:hypothetical protein